MEEYSDAELAKMSADENSGAFGEIVSRYHKQIYNLNYRLIGNADDAFDVTQEVFVKIWKNIGKYDSRASFKTWTFKIARNTAIDWLRKKRPVLFSSLETDNEHSFEESLPDREPLPPELFERKELSNLIEKALFSLSPEQRTVVILHYKDEMTFDEIAAITESSTNTIKSRYRRALIAMRKYLENAPK